MVLGGVTIPDSPGLAGHSDADVLSHAVADALLGAANLGDLGQHFPDTDPAWKDASSLQLLEHVARLAREAGFTVSSIDAVVLLETPKLAPHREDMRRNIASAIGADPSVVSVKASTTEGLGLVGRREGAACMAVVMLESG